MPIHIIPDNSENLLEGGAYLPGETLKGEIIVQTKKRLKARTLSVIYVGMEYARVERGGGKNRHTYYESYYYFNIEDILVEPKPGEETMILDGRYNFDYKFELPEEIPPTFHLYNSGIQYMIDVKIDRPMAGDAHGKLELFVLPSSLEKGNQGPLSDILRGDASIPDCELTCNNDVFYEGDTVEIQLNVQMQREPKIQDMRVSIESVSTKTARGYTDRFPNMLKGWKIDKKTLQMGENYFDFSYEIPKDVPYSVLGVLLKRDYFIHLKLNRRFHPDSHIWIPIVISPSLE